MKATAGGIDLQRSGSGALILFSTPVPKQEPVDTSGWMVQQLRHFDLPIGPTIMTRVNGCSGVPWIADIRRENIHFGGVARGISNLKLEKFVVRINVMISDHSSPIVMMI